MARMHQTGKVALGLVTCALLLGGCGAPKVPDVIENASLVVEKEGAVISYTVGFFNKDYYKVSKLRALAQEEAVAYNSAHQTGTETPVVVQQVAALEEKQGMVVVAYRFNSAETYVDYSGTPFFYGTVKQAKESGYDLSAMNQVMFDAKGSKSIVSSDLTKDDMAKKHLILAQEQAYIYCPYKVSYISEGARILEDGSVDTTGVEPEMFPVIILMSK